jgi:hypothetical protein
MINSIYHSPFNIARGDTRPVFSSTARFDSSPPPLIFEAVREGGGAARKLRLQNYLPASSQLNN